MDSDKTRSSATQFEPVFDASLSSASFSLNGGVRLRELFTDGNKGQDGILLSERRWFTRLFLTPPDLPTFSFQIDRFTRENDGKPKSINEDDTRYQLTTDYNKGGFTFSYLFSDRINKNLVSGQTRDQKNNSGALSYTGTSLFGWLDVLAGYNINYAPSREEFSQKGIAEVERQLSRGLKAAADLTPLDSSDVPLTNEPSLLTGTALVPLEVNTSVGFEQASLPPKPIATIRLNVTAQSPFIIPDNLQDFVKIQVFTTDNPNPNALNAWTQLDGSGFSVTYDPLESRLVIAWPPPPPPPAPDTTSPKARFFKLWVDANPFGGVIQVTRISALHLESVNAGTKRDQSTLAHNVNGSFTVRPPTKPWTISAISYDFNFSTVTQQPESNRNNNGTQTARLVAEPHRYLTSAFTYQHNFSNSNQEGSKATTGDLYSLVFNTSPLPTLTSSLTIARVDNRGDGKLETRADSGSLNIWTRLYRNLNVDTTYSLSRAEDFLIDQKTLSQGLTINANATLTPRLTATLGYSINWSRTEQPEQETSQLTNTLNASYTYTLSRFLNFNTRYDFLTGNDVTAFRQDYRVDWTPSPKLSAFVSYRRAQQESNGEKTGSDGVTVNGRWNLSRYLNLDGNFVFFKSFDGNTVHAFSARVQIRF